MKEDLLIFPFGGNAIEALDSIDESKYNVLGFFDDSKEKIGSHYAGVKVFSRQILEEFPCAKILAVPGSYKSYKKRKEIIDSLNISIDRFATIIDSTAKIGKQVRLGYNSLIMANTVITSNCKVGNHCVILPNSTLHHDSEINDYTLLAANVTVAGNSIIGKSCYLGSSVTIKDNLTIVENCLIGSGSNVVSDIKTEGVYIGNPAKNSN